MINRSYRLISPRQIQVNLIDEKIKTGEVIVKPLYLSICAADQRYYTGSRDKNALKNKLPMALIHEAIGEVVFDQSKTYKKGDKVVLIPNTPTKKDDVIKENYLKTSYFKSSGYDGFMQDYVFIKKDRIIKYEKIKDRVAVLLELISVSMNALEHFDKYSHNKKQVLGVWGSGSLGYITSLVLKKTFPKAEVYVFGRTREKLQYFQFADKVFTIDDIPQDIKIDHAFECVGGIKSTEAINQIIDIINPEGSIALMGVSEEKVPINTRMILEKGITLLGNSRSGYEDFLSGIDFIQNNDDVESYLENIISDEIVVNNIKDIHKAFEIDLNNEFKTIIKWNI